MAVSLTVVGFCFLSLDNATPDAGESMAGIFTLVGLVVFIASFAFSLGPVVWTVINEIFPSRIRGRGVAVATAANWGSAWLVSQFFLSLTDAIGTCGDVLDVRLLLRPRVHLDQAPRPETKGKTLEEIEELWEPQRAAAVAAQVSP